jgi:hypothetical protein
MSSEINNKFISSDKKSICQQINEKQMINNNENENKINETLSKVLVKDVMNEENKTLIEKLREENENLRQIIRLCRFDCSFWAPPTSCDPTHPIYIYRWIQVDELSKTIPHLTR